MPALSHPPKPGDPLHCACGKPWPEGCDDAKAELLREFRTDPMALLVYLGFLVAKTAKDFPCITEHQIVRQYLGWLPERALVWAWPLNSAPPTPTPPADNAARYGANAGRWSR